MKRSSAVGYLLVTALLWSTSGVLIKWVDWSPLAIAGVRSAIAAIVLWTFGRPFKFTWSKPQIGGAIAGAGTVTLFVVANKLTTAANAIFLQYTAPVYVALFGIWYLKEPISRTDWIAIAGALFGMILFFFDGLTAQYFWGNVCALASGVMFACVTLFLRKQKDTSTKESIFLGNVLTAGLAIPFIGNVGPSASGWTVLVVMGVFQLGIPYILYGKAIRHVNAIDAAMICILEPVLNPVWVYIFVGEKMGRWSFLGASIILVSLLARNFPTARMIRMRQSYFKG